MTRQNILNEKWFISFKRSETEEKTIDFAGRILGEAADGWFYVEIFGTGWNIAERKVLPVAELASARFYRTELEFRDARYSGPILPPKGANQ